MTEQEYLAEIFAQEAGEMIDRFGQLAESIADESIERRKSILEELFRVAHNLKGAARILGYADFETLTHRLEQNLVPLKEKPEMLTQSAILQYIKASSDLRVILENCR